MRILVTDDDPSILCLVATILRRANYDVDTAASGREAIEKTEQTQYDAIVLDLMMPLMSGLEVLAHLAVRTRKRRFVVVMSAAPLDVIGRAAGHNVFAALQKPAAINEIVATVHACIAAA
jgi:DNA-binding response OmpR family regulator